MSRENCADQKVIERLKTVPPNQSGEIISASQLKGKDSLTPAKPLWLPDAKPAEAVAKIGILSDANVSWEHSPSFLKCQVQWRYWSVKCSETALSSWAEEHLSLGRKVSWKLGETYLHDKTLSKKICWDLHESVAVASAIFFFFKK